LVKKTLRDIDTAGKRVLVRVDFNVPINGSGNVTDDNRLRTALPTINYLVENKAKVILVSHLGRPKGKVVEKYKMDPVAESLSGLMGRRVVKVDDCVGEVTKNAVAGMKEGDVLLLENVRFHPEEEKNDAGFARRLAEPAEVFVNDAFGAAHRAHASTTGVARFLPAVAGFLMEKELEALGGILEAPGRPFAAVIGGAKVSDKINFLSSLLQKVDLLIIGGGMANTFLATQGYDVGKSLLEADKAGLAKEIIKEAGDRGVKFLLPVDVVAAKEAAPGAARVTVTVDQIPPDYMVLDIGPKTVAYFTEALKNAKTVFWNGPMGVFEIEDFSRGTKAVARALAGIDAVTVIGGGDSVAAVRDAGVADKMTHNSTGGGASLKFLEGKQLPGVAALLDR